MALSKKTRDHDEIRTWAETRGAKPAEVASTDDGKGPGILRLEFPKAPHSNDSKLQEISWEAFFEKFDANDLELILQDLTADGEQSNFNKFVHPDHEEHSSKSGKSKEKPAASEGSSGSQGKKSGASQGKKPTGKVAPKTHKTAAK